MTMQDYNFGAKDALIVGTNNDFVQTLGAMDGVATGTQHDALTDLQRGIVRVGPPLSTERSVFQYDDAIPVAGPQMVQGIVSGHHGSPNGNWGNAACYLGAKCVPGSSRGILLGMKDNSGGIALSLNRLGVSLQGAVNTPSVTVAMTGVSTPPTKWQALKMVVRRIDKDTQIDVWRDFNVTSALVTWVHSFTVLLRQGPSLFGWLHDPLGDSISVGSLNGETESVWNGYAGWGAGSTDGPAVGPNYFNYIADFFAAR
jgi:hypothetical protein